MHCSRNADVIKAKASLPMLIYFYDFVTVALLLHYGKSWKGNEFDTMQDCKTLMHLKPIERWSFFVFSSRLRFLEDFLVS